MRLQHLVLSLALLAAPAAWSQDGTEPPAGAPPSAPPVTATDGSADAGAPTAPVDPNAPERISGRVPEELEAYRKTKERFVARMSELEKGTETYINIREAEELAKLADGYDSLLDTLGELEIAKRDQAVEVFENFLKQYPDVEYADHVRFRLGELYFEVQKDKFAVENDAYNALADELGMERMDELPEPPRTNLQPSLDLYLQIIAKNKALPKEQQYEFLDACYYMVAFIYMEANGAQRDEALARAALDEMVQVRPDSDLSDVAHLYLGNFAFDDSNMDLAIAEYKLVYDKGPEGKLYDQAMYQLAWSYYKMAQTPDQYNVALDRFAEVLKYSEVTQRESGRPSEFRPDAVKYMAISFYDLAEKQLRPAMDIAREYFSKGEPQEYEWDVYVELAELMTQLARYPDAIKVYEYLQSDPRWVNRPENPDFQMQVVKLWVSGLEPDQEKSGAARIVLTERYNDDTPWWEANRNNPEALAAARRHIEASLATVAIEYRVLADKSQKPEDYLIAAEKFREYLDKFPIADDYYKQQWYLADTLMKAGALEDAAKEYKLLVKSRRSHEHGDGAVFLYFRTQYEMVMAQHKTLEARPEGAVLERSYPRLDNKKDEAGNPVMVDVYTLTDEHRRLIEAADQLANWRFTPPEEGKENEYLKAADELRPTLKYIPGQILFYYNRYDEARARLVEIVDPKKYRYTQIGSFAAALIVNSYSNEGDFQKVRTWTTDFIRNPPGTTGAPPEGFAATQEGAAYKICFLMSESDRAGAADCYLQFRKDFPKSEYAKDALYSAANNFQIIGKADQSNTLFEQYVNEYPNDPKSEGLYYRIALNYESTLDLQQAITYYERLVKLFPNNVDAAVCWFNAAFLRVGLGDHRGAAKAFEEYAARFPNEPDIESVFYSAGEQWEKVSQADAKRFYEKYLADSRFRGVSIDHRFESRYKLAEIALAEKKPQVHAKILDDILSDFKTVAQTDPSKLGWAARHYAAEAAFREVQTEYDKLVKTKLTGNEEKDVKILLEEKPAEIRAFMELANSMAQYGDFEYLEGAIYLMGAAHLYFTDLGYSIKCPTKMSEEECVLFDEVVQTQILPQFQTVQDQAITFLTKVITSAQEKKIHVHWVDKAQNALNELNPKDYPALKIELRGGTDATIYPAVKPMEMAAPGAKPVTPVTPAPSPTPAPEPTPAPGGQP